MVVRKWSTAFVFAATLALTACTPGTANPAAHTPSALETSESVATPRPSTPAAQATPYSSPATPITPVAPEQPDRPGAMATPHSSPAPPITPVAPEQPEPLAPLAVTPQVPLAAPSIVNPQPLQCPSGEVAIQFTSKTSTKLPSDMANAVVITGTVANQTSQDIYITPLRMYPLGLLQVDLSVWALYSSQTNAAPIVLGRGQTVMFTLRETIAWSVDQAIDAWMFNPGFTKVTYAAQPYASTCSVQANWGPTIDNR